MHKILNNYFDLILTRYPIHRVLAVLVRGSQNYNQSTPSSDLDAVAVIALAFMSCDALEEAMRDPLPFSQAEYEAADEEATIHNLWRLKEDRRFTSTIITEGGVKNE